MKMNNETEQLFLLNAAPNQASTSTQKMGSLALPPSSQVNLEDVKDFSHVCRTCATITEFVMPIFAGEGLQNNLADKIKKHLPIQVCEGDELPLVVCYQCASTLLAWHELVQCCVQADAALRAKLSSNQRKTIPPNVNIKSSSSIKEETQTKFTSVPMYGPAQPQHYRACTYCVSSHPVSGYKEHLVTAHSDLLFHCEECNAYIDKKDFFIHMSLHALQYTTQETKKKKIKKKEDVSCKEESQSVHNPSPVPPENRPLLKKTNDIKPAVVKTKTSVEDNEFSDHSDMEGFGPLPESVFEAIEDSQDSQHLEYDTSHTTPENERCSDESNKCPEPKNNNLNNPAVYTKLNNCSVVIESMDLNNCSQINIAIKNDKINNNLAVLPANSTAPNSSDVSDNDATHDRAKKSHKKTRKCPFCPKQYTASSSYYYHLKYFHKGSKEHACQVCAKKFGTRSCLTQHMAIHTGHHEFKCTQCKKQFKSKAGLYIHEQTHNGKKSWSCSQCHTAFRWKTHLFRHMKRHTAEKSHVCTTCGRGFSVRCDLLRHARTHAAKSITCDKCGQKFAQLRYLKVHTIKQHSNGISKLSK